MEAFQLKPIPVSVDAKAEAPSFQIGDEWHFTGGVYPGTVRVVAVGGGETVTEFLGYSRCSGCRAYRDANLTVQKILDLKGERWADADVLIKELDFPLQVGTEWKQDVDIQGRAYRNRFVVNAYEEITVKAGTFRAFRIVQRQQALVGNWSGSRRRWWSPEARWWVAFECWKSDGPGRTGTCRDTELESYTLK